MGAWTEWGCLTALFGTESLANKALYEFTWIIFVHNLLTRSGYIKRGFGLKIRNLH